VSEQSLMPHHPHQHITYHFGNEFPVNHLHWYSQSYQNNQQKKTQNNQTQSIWP